MAKPIAVQKLKHGKALCGKTFGKFVETFNWLVDFCQGLQGDKDANNANGRISLDRSNESAPVIRMDAAEGGGGGGDGEPEEEPLEPGADPDNPYVDPEDTFDDDEAINGDGNDISNDTGFVDDDVGGGGDYCNRISDLGGGAPSEGGGNDISNTCSK